MEHRDIQRLYDLSELEYELVEVSAPEPYVISAENTKFTVKSDKADTLTIPYEVIVTNDVQRGTLEVFKADSETKKPLKELS